MNQVSSADVTLFSLALAAFGGASTALTDHDWYVSGGLTVLGVILVYIYHKFGSAVGATNKPPVV
jgi:hypothetical protein